MEALRVEEEQSKEPRMGARRGGGAVVRVERRRNWSDEEKLAILKETTQPGAIIAAIARRYGIGTGQLYTWRKQLLRGAMAGFVPVELVQPEPVGKIEDTGRIDIRRGGGFTVSVDKLVDRQALRLVLEIVGELEG
jgi:transposase